MTVMSYIHYQDYGYMFQLTVDIFKLLKDLRTHCSRSFSTVIKYAGTSYTWYDNVCSGTVGDR
jgi:hypothetical protein